MEFWPSFSFSESFLWHFSICIRSLGLVVSSQKQLFTRFKIAFLVCLAIPALTSTSRSSSYCTWVSKLIKLSETKIFHFQRLLHLRRNEGHFIPKMSCSIQPRNILQFKLWKTISPLFLRSFQLILSLPNPVNPFEWQPTSKSRLKFHSEHDLQQNRILTEKMKL